jgi:hypothetical protein
MIGAALPPLRLLSPREPPADEGGVRCAFIVQNERLRLPDFLRHHRALGVSRFLALDDRSTDGTREMLLAQPDVTLFEIDASYQDSLGSALWKNALLDRDAVGRWAVVIDVDELLVYPHHDRVDLGALCAYLDSRGATCATATMVDMYPRDLESVRGFREGDRMVDACPWFDREGYRKHHRLDFPRSYLRGGSRARLFYDEPAPAWARAYMQTYRMLEAVGLQRLMPRADVSRWEAPFLTKVSLVKWQRGMRFVASSHWLRPAARCGDVTTALLHFKFLGDFADKVARAVEAKNYWKDSAEYRRYAAKLAKDPGFGFAYPGSARYRGPGDLVAAGLMDDPPHFAAQAQRASPTRSSVATA